MAKSPGRFFCIGAKSRHSHAHSDALFRTPDLRAFTAQRRQFVVEAQSQTAASGLAK